MNAKRVAKLAREKPNQPDQTLIDWVNFVLANGRLSELKPELLNQTFISYNNLDLLGIFFAAIFVFVQCTKQLVFVSLHLWSKTRNQKTKMC